MKNENKGGNDHATRERNRTERAGPRNRRGYGARSWQTSGRRFWRRPGRQLRLSQVRGKSAPPDGIALLSAALSEVWGCDDARIIPGWVPDGCRLGRAETWRSRWHCRQTSFLHGIPLRPAQAFIKTKGLSSWRFYHYEGLLQGDGTSPRGFG
jgi:hypothetical protein